MGCCPRETITARLQLQHWLYDEKVNIELLKDFMEENTYQYLCERIKNEQVRWICDKCDQDLSEESVSCGSCLIWVDNNCSNIPSKILRSKKKLLEYEYYCD